MQTKFYLAYFRNVKHEYAFTCHMKKKCRRISFQFQSKYFWPVRKTIFHWISTFHSEVSIDVLLLMERKRNTLLSSGWANWIQRMLPPNIIFSFLTFYSSQHVSAILYVFTQIGFELSWEPNHRILILHPVNYFMHATMVNGRFLRVIFQIWVGRSLDEKKFYTRKSVFYLYMQVQKRWVKWNLSSYAFEWKGKLSCNKVMHLHACMSYEARKIFFLSLCFSQFYLFEL